MSTELTNKVKNIHLDYKRRKGEFSIDCNQSIFSEEEREILYEYGHWFQGLTNKELLPYTEMQRRFVEVAQGKLKPDFPEEIAWFKYLGRKKYEEKHGDKYLKSPKLDDDTFYNRDMAKKQKLMMYGIMRKNHKE